MCMGETLAEVVEVSVSTWACMGVLASAFYFVMLAAADNTKFLAWFMCGCGWFISAFNVFFQGKVLAIRDSFAPQDYRLLLNGIVNKDEHSPLVADGTLPAWCSVNIGAAKLEYRSKFWKWMLGAAPNRQQLLYWGQTNGTDLHLLVFRITLLFNGLYVALMAVTFVPGMWKHCGKASEVGSIGMTEFMVFCVLAVIPVYLQVTGKRRMVATMTHISCIGCLRRNHVISNVIREEKTSRAVRAFIVLHKIHLATQQTDGAAKSESKSHRRHYTTVLPPHITQDISKTFDLFDDDGSGAISTEELEELMKSLGSPCDGKQLGVMISLLDENGDGDISKEEFIQWYSEQLQKNELDPREMAKSMFGMFDKDGNGSITIAEFKEALDAFNVGLSMDDVAELVKELDEDRNGLIDEEEFAHLLRRHAHPPPELSSLSQMY